jgi:hypothetical protein
MKTDVKMLAKRYFQAYSEKNSTKLAEMFSEDITLTDWEIHIIGKNAVIEANRKIFDSTNQILVEIINMYSDAETVAAEIEVAIDNKPRIYVADFLTFNADGLIKRLMAYKC